MATIRILAARDVPGVAALLMRTYPGQRWSTHAACEAYLREILFDSPWRELALPSWVAEEDGWIRGCYGILPRPMRFRGRPIRAAVGCVFMVDPGPRRGLVALQLAKAGLTGPQDLTLADGANDEARHAWAGIGGSVSVLNSMHWTRPLRPAGYLLALLEERALGPRLLARAARPLGAAVDMLAGRARPNRFLREPADAVEEPLEPETMFEHLPRMLRGCALQPEYDRRSLAWVIDQAARKSQYGELRGRCVRAPGGPVIGWYLYYLKPGATGEVVQLAAAGGAMDRVLQRLLADAWRHGASAVHGRLDARWARELCARHCWLRTDSTWTLAHSRTPEITAAILQGDSYLSRLDGEWLLGASDGGAARTVAAAPYSNGVHAMPARQRG